MTVHAIHRTHPRPPSAYLKAVSGTLSSQNVALFSQMTVILSRRKANAKGIIHFSSLRTLFLWSLLVLCTKTRLCTSHQPENIIYTLIDVSQICFRQLFLKLSATFCDFFVCVYVSVGLTTNFVWIQSDAGSWASGMVYEILFTM